MGRMKQSRMQGKINIGCLIITLLLIAGGYVGFKFGKVYMAKYFLDKKIFQIAGDAAQDWKAKTYPTNRDIAEAVLLEAKSRGADMDIDDITAERDDRTVTIQATWEGDIVLPYYTHHFVFTFDHTRRIE
jgi:hypothetical protein